MIKKMIIVLSLILSFSLISTGCAAYRVKANSTGEWTACGYSLFKEINVPIVAVTNSTTAIYVNGYKSSSGTEVISALSEGVAKGVASGLIK